MTEHSRYTENDFAPEIPHLGERGEIGDLRRDVSRAFKRVEDELSDRLLGVDVEVGTPAAGEAEVTARVVAYQGGEAVEKAVPFTLVVYDNDEQTVASATGTLDTVSEGTLLKSSGAAIIVESSPAGVVRCILHGLGGSSYHVGVERANGSPAMDLASTYKNSDTTVTF